MNHQVSLLSDGNKAGCIKQAKLHVCSVSHHGTYSSTCGDKQRADDTWLPSRQAMCGEQLVLNPKLPEPKPVGIDITTLHNTCSGSLQHTKYAKYIQKKVMSW